MNKAGWGVLALSVGLGVPMALLALWGWLIWLAVGQSQAVVVDHATSEGTAHLPTLLTSAMVIVTEGRDPRLPENEQCWAGFEGRGSGRSGSNWNTAPVLPEYPIFRQGYRIAIADVLSSEAFAEASRGRTDEPWPLPMRVWSGAHAGLLDNVYHGDGEDVVFTTGGCLPWRVEPAG